MRKQGLSIYKKLPTEIKLMIDVYMLNKFKQGKVKKTVGSVFEYILEINNYIIEERFTDYWLSTNMIKIIEREKYGISILNMRNIHITALRIHNEVNKSKPIQHMVQYREVFSDTKGIVTMCRWRSDRYH